MNNPFLVNYLTYSLDSKENINQVLELCQEHSDPQTSKDSGNQSKIRHCLETY